MKVVIVYMHFKLNVVTTSHRQLPEDGTKYVNKKETK